MDRFFEYKQKIEEGLAALIPVGSVHSSSLYEGGRYSLLTPGKRIRPLLTLLVAELFQDNACSAALQPALALELVHTYSLIHDDLPCMDNDDFRRGLPTLHKVYTEGHAVLVGDYLLTYAFELLTVAPFLEEKQKLALVRVLAQAAGGEGMIGGQIMDIEHSAHVECMHTRKTAALFSASVEFGGIVVKASSAHMVSLKEFGLHFGKLFQMVDDLKDQDHPLGQELAEVAAHRHFHATLATLEKLPGDHTCLKQLTESIIDCMQIIQG